MRARHARLRDSMKRRKDPPPEWHARPTPEGLRRAGPDVARGHTGQITMRDSPLERAFARNALTPEQYSAGQKYRHHWYHAGLADRLESIDLNRIVAIDLDHAGTDPRGADGERCIARFQRPIPHSLHSSSKAVFIRSTAAA